MNTELRQKYGKEYSKERNVLDLQSAMANLMDFWATGESEHTMKTFIQMHSFELNDFAVSLLRHIAESNRHLDKRIHSKLCKAAREIWGFDD